MITKSQIFDKRLSDEKKFSLAKARKYIESFGVRLNEDINKRPISHGSNSITFRLTKEQHELMYQCLEKWKPWDSLAMTDGYYLWEVGNRIPRPVIGLTSFPKVEFEIFLNNSYQG